MTRQMHGIVRGKTIELADETGLQDGSPVVITLRSSPRVRTWGEGIRRSAGAWANDPNIDDVLTEIESIREQARFRDLDQ